MIQLVFAYDKHYGFGKNDQFPWPHISQDLKNFKARTKDTILVMGAKTFASLPGKLPGRRHIVFCDFERSMPITKDGSIADEYLDIKLMSDYLRVWTKVDLMYSIIGGVHLLTMALPFASRVVYTQIDHINLDKEGTTQWLTESLKVAVKLFDADEVNEYNSDLYQIKEQVVNLG